MNVALKIERWGAMSEAERQAALARPRESRDDGLIERTADIVGQVRRGGDQALGDLTRKFDGKAPAALRVDDEQLASAWTRCPQAEREAMTHARRNIRTFHEAQNHALPTVTVENGVICRQLRRPIGAVGLYVPGGSAPLPSALLMLATPASIAGCPRIVVCSPPRADGRIADRVLAAAHLCGVHEVYAVGGAQAIAALAFGTESLPAVDKIFGPGNAYVTAAKMLAAQDPAGAACDMPAGPSEVLVVADDGAAPQVVAADLLAQAEHGPDSQVLLFTDSAALAEAVSRAVANQVRALSRAPIVADALAHSRTVVFDSLDEAMAASNAYAPEHLILNTRDALARVDQVTCAGSVFVGPWAAETFGDYCSGTNHVLPTYGFARAYSGVSLKDFNKFITVQQIEPQGFDRMAGTARTLARMEGLDAHEAAVSVRQGLRDARERSA